MARLVDADELKSNKRIIGTSNYCEYCVVNVDDIDKAPTVDAVLREQINKMVDEVLRIGQSGWLDISTDQMVDIIDKYCGHGVK